MGYAAYLALKHAQSSLKDIHDGVVDAFPVVDDFVVVDACDQEHRPVILARLLYALCLCFFRIPTTTYSSLLFYLCDAAKELNVARGEQIPASIDVDNCLARLHALAMYHLRELALLFLDGMVVRDGLLASASA